MKKGALTVLWLLAHLLFYEVAIKLVAIFG
jgi:hypothetical protein